MSLEIERKYLDADFEALKRALLDHGASSSGSRFEVNLVFDNENSSLLAQNKLLRLRCNISRQKREWICTVKRPIAPPHDTDVKIREEFETEIANGSSFCKMLEILGFRLTGCYEKLRASWHLFLPSLDAAVSVELDQMPFCRAVEIEGSEEAINATALLLHLDKLKRSPTNYSNLYNIWLAEQGLPPSTCCLFEDSQKKELTASLGISPDDLPQLPIVIHKSSQERK